MIQLVFYFKFAFCYNEKLIIIGFKIIILFTNCIRFTPNPQTHKQTNIERTQFINKCLLFYITPQCAPSRDYNTQSILHIVCMMYTLVPGVEWRWATNCAIPQPLQLKSAALIIITTLKTLYQPTTRNTKSAYNNHRTYSGYMRVVERAEHITLQRVVRRSQITLRSAVF